MSILKDQRHSRRIFGGKIKQFIMYAFQFKNMKITCLNSFFFKSMELIQYNFEFKCSMGFLNNIELIMTTIHRFRFQNYSNMCNHFDKHQLLGKLK